MYFHTVYGHEKILPGPGNVVFYIRTGFTNTQVSSIRIMSSGPPVS